MPEPVLKRHRGRAVWLGRLSEYVVPLAAFVFAALDALRGNWDVVLPWLAMGIVALFYQHRVGTAWSWGWREGHDEALCRVMPYVQLNRENVSELQDAFAAEAPTWRQRQDELSQIDVKATMKATMEQLEQMLGPTDEPGPK